MLESPNERLETQLVDHVTRRKSSRVGLHAEGRKSTFNFAYPNLYLVTSDGASVLLTHVPAS